MMRRLLLLATLLLGALPARAAAPKAAPAEPPHRWFTALRYQHDALSDGRPAWLSATALVQYDYGTGSLVFESRRTSRFDASDDVLSVAAWSDLWRGAYGTLQIERAFDPAFSAGATGFGELYQALGAGWEAAASYQVRRYPNETIHLPGAALARYVGAWYVRTKTTLLPRAGELGIAQSLMARRYWDAPHSYIGVSAGIGRGVEIVGPGPDVVFTRSYGLSASAQRFVTEHVGLAVEAHYNDVDFFTWTGFSAGLMVRW